MIHEPDVVQLKFFLNQQRMLWLFTRVDDVVVKDMWIYNNKLLANFVSNTDQADKLFEANFRVVSVFQLNILVKVIQDVDADNAIKISRTGKELHKKMICSYEVPFFRCIFAISGFLIAFPLEKLVSTVCISKDILPDLAQKHCGLGFLRTKIIQPECRLDYLNYFTSTVKLSVL